MRNQSWLQRSLVGLGYVVFAGSSFNLQAQQCLDDVDYTRWGLDKPNATKLYCLTNEHINSQSDPNIIDGDKVTLLHNPISTTAQFNYNNGVSRNNAPEGKFSNHQFGSVNNAIIPSIEKFAFHTGLDLFAVGSDGGEKSVKSAFDGKIVWAGKHSNSSGYAVAVYSRLRYPITMPTFKYRYSRAFNGGGLVTGDKTGKIHEFVAYYLHLDRCQDSNSKKLDESLVNQPVQSGQHIGYTFKSLSGNTGEYTTCSSLLTAEDKKPVDRYLGFAGHLHLEVMLTQTNPIDSSDKSVLNANGYDTSAEANSRVNQHYVDPEVLFSKIRQRNALLRNLSRSELYCADDDSCEVDANINPGHMAMAQHFLGHDRSLMVGLTAGSDSVCTNTDEICEYNSYQLAGKTYIIADNLEVIHTDLAPFWQRSDHGLPQDVAVYVNGMLRQPFQYALHSKLNDLLVVKLRSTKVVTPRAASTSLTDHFEHGGIEYWSTNHVDNKLYFELGEANRHFVMVEKLNFHIPNDAGEAHLNRTGEDFDRDGTTGELALYSKPAGAQDSQYTIETNATFGCLTQNHCPLPVIDTTTNKVAVAQHNFSGEVNLTVNANYQQGRTYAIGFAPQKTSSTKGVAISTLAAGLISPRSPGAKSALFSNSASNTLCRKNIETCQIQ